MIKQYSTEAIVIKRVNVSESDKLLTIFTDKYGKLVVIAKGIRRINSRKAPHLELFTHVKTLIGEGRTWDYLLEAQTIESFNFLRERIERIVQAFQIVEEIDRLCPEREVHNNIFGLILRFLRIINDKNFLKNTDYVEEFTVNLLWELGYLPYGKVMSPSALYRYLEQVMEKNLKSRTILKKI